MKKCKAIKALILSCEDSISRGAAVQAEGQRNHIKEEEAGACAMMIHCCMYTL